MCNRIRNDKPAVPLLHAILESVLHIHQSLGIAVLKRMVARSDIHVLNMAHAESMDCERKHKRRAESVCDLQPRMVIAVGKRRQLHNSVVVVTTGPEFLSKY